MAKDNRGLSLVEIIIVISILSILSVAGVIGVGMISGKPAEQCAENIKVSLLNNRTTALGKFKTDITIEDNGSGIELTENIYGSAPDGTLTVESSKKTKIGESTVSVAYSYTDPSSGYTEINSSTPLTISFDRATGAVILPPGGTDLYIRCSKSDKTYVLQVYHLTGKVVLMD